MPKGLTVSQAKRNIGNFSKTEKLNLISEDNLRLHADKNPRDLKPADGLNQVYSWGSDARNCITGSKLVEVKDSNCFACYAQEGYYSMTSSQRAVSRRESAYSDNPRKFVESFVHLANNSKLLTNTGQFRWFDSGDLASYQMLLDLVEIARRSPKVRWWMPTKEYKWVSKYQREIGEFPANFIVRVTAPMRNTRIRDDKYRNNCTVFDAKKFELEKGKNTDQSIAFCPSYQQGNKCLSCDSCYDVDVKTVVYKWRSFGKDS